MKQVLKTNFRKLLRIHRLSRNEQVFVYRDKLVKYKNGNVAVQTLYPTTVPLWHTGEVIWQNNRLKQEPLKAGV